MRTMGRMFIRLLESAYRSDLDRLLNAPTNDAWIFPWVDYLKLLGVKFFNSSELTSIEFDGSEISSVTINNTTQITADYYLFAMPVDRISPLITEEMKRFDPSIANLDKLHTDWMNGIQFFIKKKEPIVPGHVGYFDSVRC